MKVGVYVCDCGINITSTVDVPKVVNEIGTLSKVVLCREYKYMCSDPGQEMIKKDISEEKLDRVVVASCSPRMHEPTFRALCKEAGMNPFQFEMANIREQCSWVHGDKSIGTEKAIELIRGAVARAIHLEPLEMTSVGVTSNALVIGGGIAGIQTALDIADMGYKTYLVEKTPSVGGRMSQLDKTFPTLDCSACILTPKMVDVGRHPNIELITCAEVENVDGYVGNFHVKIRKKPTYVDWEKCIGCGECSKVCPVAIPNEFNFGLDDRNAISVPFPQAVPLKYTISREGLQPCKSVCPAQIGAPGYVSLVSRGKFYQALKVIKEHLPFPSICGRVCHRPCENACTRKEIDEPVGIAQIKRFVGDFELEIPIAKTPPIDTRAEKVAIIGGGPAGLTAANDLALLGYHVSIFEEMPVLGGMMRFGIPTFRLPKEILEKEITDVTNLGIRIFLNMKVGREITIKEIMERGYRAVFLAIGAQKGKKSGLETESLEGVFQSIEFLKDLNLGVIKTTPIASISSEICFGCGLCMEECPYETIVDMRRPDNDVKPDRKKNPYILEELCRGCGKCAAICPVGAIKLSGLKEAYPKIGNRVAVIGGGNAALDTARSCLRLGSGDVKILYRRSREEMPAEPEWEIDETIEEGVKLEFLTVPTKFISENGRIKAIECVKMELGDVDKTGRRKPLPIPGSEYTMEVDSLIYAIGQEVALDEISDDFKIETTRTGIIKVDPVTLETSVKGVFSGGDAILGSGTIIEAIGAGKRVAESIDRYINGIDLTEGRDKMLPVFKPPVENVKKRKKIPMRMLPLNKRKNNFQEVELGYSLEEAIKEARRCLDCGGCVECYECVAVCEADAIDHNMNEEMIEVDVGSIVVATGFDLFDAASLPEYGYDQLKNVISGIEFERLVSASGPTGGHIEINGKEPEKVVFIQCVGSRDRDGAGNEHCSRVCCMYTAKQAHLVREKMPDSDVTIYYTDVRAFGKGFEEFYVRVQEEGVHYRRRQLSDEIEVIKDNGKLVVKAAGQSDIEADLVVLASGIVPREGSGEMANLLRISRSADGFMMEAHPKLRPIDTFTSGIFLAGCCQGPKDIPDTVAQASGAAARVGSILSKDNLEIGGSITVVEKDLCAGCLTCVRVCPYNVPSINEEGVAQIIAAECQGCGICVGECPAKAIQLQHYKDNQILAQCDGILAEGIK